MAVISSGFNEFRTPFMSARSGKERKYELSVGRTKSIQNKRSDLVDPFWYTFRVKTVNVLDHKFASARGHTEMLLQSNVNKSVVLDVHFQVKRLKFTAFVATPEAIKQLGI